MKKLFSTTCIPADVGQTQRSFMRRFARDEEGNITILAVALTAALGILSAISWDLIGFDYHRVKIQQIADRAVLAAADLDQTIDPTVVVQEYFDKAGYPDLVSTVTVDEGLNYRTVSVDVKGVVESQFISSDYSGGAYLGGRSRTDAEREAAERIAENRLSDANLTDEEIRELVLTAAREDEGTYINLHAFSEAEERINNVEISLVLDISGSMGSGDKMSNLRDAARTFVDAVVNPSTVDLVSVSIVPYSEHVSAGPEILDQFNINRTHSYSHCIEFDEADFDTTVMGPSKEYDQVQHFYWGTTSWNKRTNPVCPTGQYEDVVAFSQDVTALKNKIGQLVPRGSTSIFAGMKWAAGLLDPSFQPINANLSNDGHSDPAFADRPAAFDDYETLKTVILMTDGQNHYSKRITPSVYANSSHWAHWNNNNFDWWVRQNVYSSQRQYWSSSKYWPDYGDSLLSNVCDAAKAKNIVIWSIGFEVTEHGANVMRDCASSPSHYFGVEGVEIKEAFSAIARQINQLRLTQ